MLEWPVPAQLQAQQDHADSGSSRMHVTHLPGVAWPEGSRRARLQQERPLKVLASQVGLTQSCKLTWQAAGDAQSV
jgi:hypothetical protein